VNENDNSRLASAKASPKKARLQKLKSDDYSSKEQQRINTYVKSKKLNFNTAEPKKPTVTKEDKLRKEAEKVKLLTMKYDNVMIKSQKLYETYEKFDHKDLLYKLDMLEVMYERLQESTAQILQANKTAFFFINFYKDFETKVIYNSKVKGDKSLYAI
jgi:hypothetical protein